MLRPDNDSWVAQIYDSQDAAAKRLGCAVVIDGFRLLTCHHVVADDGIVRDRVWVAFPKAVGTVQRRRQAASVERADADLDVALLRLAEGTPRGVAAAPLRRSMPGALVGQRWWAFGFTDESHWGSGTSGTVGESLGHGYVRLDADRSAQYRLRTGYSGGGVWSPDAGGVVGVLVTADEYHGNGEAITLHQVDLQFPEEKLRELTQWTIDDADDVALAAWALRSDPERARHWGPRARGVTVDTDRGFRFRGRTAALTEIVDWLDRDDPDNRVLVLTGSPGAGKSAVLGRIVTTADRELSERAPRDDYVYAPEGSVACAVLAKGKTALEVAFEIARAASAALPETIEVFAAGVREALSDLGPYRFNVIIDALDEATSPSQTRAIVTQVILPLVNTCADIGVQVVVGSRRYDNNGDLLDVFEEAAVVIDLDDARFFQQEDLAAYALATLQLSGAERLGNPYADERIARPVAARIAALSRQNFLIAGLTALDHGRHDHAPVDPAGLTVASEVKELLLGYLQRLEPVAGLSPTTALTALAFADNPGFPLGLWQAAVHALTGEHVSERSLALFARSSAANFLVESSGPDSTRSFRLFHQALNDSLFTHRARDTAPAEDHRAVTRAFAAHGRAASWAHAPAYLLRSLSNHAARAGLLDELLADDEFLLYADLPRLAALEDGPLAPEGRARVRLLRLTPQAVRASAAERCALFSVTETLEHLGDSYRSADAPVPYRARWAAASPRTERIVLEGHDGPVNAVCALTSGGSEGEVLLASAGRDGTVRTWDPRSGSARRTLKGTLKGHEGAVNAVCAFTVGDRVLLASGGIDGTLRTWDPRTGRALLTSELRLDSDQEPARIQGICSFTSAGRTLLAIVGYQRGMWIWDPSTGITRSYTADFSANGVCAFSSGDEILLASAGGDGVVRTWDANTGAVLGTLKGHRGVPEGDTLAARRTIDDVDGVCAFSLAGRIMLASAGYDGTVQTWDPRTGMALRTFKGHEGERHVMGVCAFREGKDSVLPGDDPGKADWLASAGVDGTVRTWDPETGEAVGVLTGHHGPVNGVCAFTLGNGLPLLASAGSDGTVRIWDTSTAAARQAKDGVGAVNGLCVFPSSHTSSSHLSLASAGRDGVVRTWNLSTGEALHTMRGNADELNDVCACTSGGKILLASGGKDGKVRIWNPETGSAVRTLRSHSLGVDVICSFQAGGRSLLITAGYGLGLLTPGAGLGLIGYNMQIRDASTWSTTQKLGLLDILFYANTADAICTVDSENGHLLAFALSGKMLTPKSKIKIWDPESGKTLFSLDDFADNMCAFALNGRMLLAAASHGVVSIWDLKSRTMLRTLSGHTGNVKGVCAFVSGDHTLLATVSDDRTVRTWDPGTGENLLVIPVHHPGLAVQSGGDNVLAIGLSAGLLILEVTAIDEMETN